MIIKPVIDENIRVLPHVCGRCKDLILPPFDYYAEFKDGLRNDFVYVCDKCRR